MSDLYWISVLGNLNTWFCLIVIVSFIAVISLLIGWIIWACNNEDTQTFIKGMKVSIPILIISSVGLLFIPSKQDLYVIYGLGSVIEYTQSSDEAKQLPDNAIKALNKYLESLTEENK